MAHPAANSLRKRHTLKTHPAAIPKFDQEKTHIAPKNLEVQVQYTNRPQYAWKASMRLIGMTHPLRLRLQGRRMPSPSRWPVCWTHRGLTGAGLHWPRRRGSAPIPCSPEQEANNIRQC
eukprot:scaffold63559_cov18-Prasinocladus_malaysianus.AAC.1